MIQVSQSVSVTANKRFWSLASVGLLLVGMSTAVMAKGEKAAKGKKDAKPAVTKVAIDTKASQLDWTGSKVTGAAHNGTVKAKDGYVEMQGGNFVGGKVVFDLATIVNLDITDKTFNDKLVTHLKSDDFFNVEKFPTATIVLKSAEKQSDGSMKVKGDLTIRDVTKPVDFVAKTAADGKSAEADLTIDRTEWNLRYGSGKFFKNLGDKMIVDQVSFKVKLAFASSIMGAH